MQNAISLRHPRVLWGTAMAAFLATLLLLISGMPARGQTVVATAPAGQFPVSLAVNPVTDRIYVSNLGSGNITVIDGATNSTTTVTDPNADFLQGVAVNPVTNKIYVANFNGTVTVIDGATNSITTVRDPNASGSHFVAVNSVTNKIYVLNWISSNITVIDGATNSTTTVRDPNAAQPHFVAVNPVTNKIYVPNWGSGNVTVIDGATNSTTTVTDPNASVANVAAVNPLTNTIYVSNYESNNVTVVDGATNSFTTVTDPNAIHPGDVALNPLTNKIYVVNGGTGPYAGSNNITVIEGATNATTTVTDPNANDSNSVAVDPVTNKIYVANWGSNNVTVIDGPTNSTMTVTDPHSLHPNTLDVNPTTNRVYVANGGGFPYGGSNNITVIAGAAAGPGLLLNPSSLTFALQATGSTSTAQKVRLRDDGTQALSITSIVASGDFAQTNDCPVSPATVPPAGFCTLSVTFTPTAAGIRSGAITITENAPGSPHKLLLSGTGSVPMVSLTPASLTFASQAVGTTSAAQLSTLKNTGDGALKITSIGPSGDFYEGNNCPTTLAAGDSCTLRVTFTPTSGGTRLGAVTIWDNAPGSPHKLALNGTGSGTGSIVLTLSPASLTFGSVAVGETSSSQTVTLKNTGTAAASFLDPFGFATTGTNWSDFHKNPWRCGRSLAPGASCQVSVHFKPLAPGTRTGYFAVRQGAASVQIRLSGTGTGPFNAVRDFSIRSNPNGVWSYGWTDSLGGTLNLYKVTDTTSVPGLSVWLASGTFGVTPDLAHNDTATEICVPILTLCVPPTYLRFHPGRGGQYSLVRWTAPSGGTFTIRGAFEGLDYVGPTTTDVHVLVNSKESLFSGPITSYESPLSFVLTVKVKVRDTIDFAVGFGADGYYEYDSTGI